MTLSLTLDPLSYTLGIAAGLALGFALLVAWAVVLMGRKRRAGARHTLIVQ